MADKKAERAAMLEKFKKEHPATKVETKEGGTVTVHGEVPTVETKTEEAAPEPTPVEPKNFPSIQSQQNGVTCNTIIMSMKDIVDYVTYAKDLYSVPKDEEGNETELSASDTWQRQLNIKRCQNEIGPYLMKEPHFFPPLVCVPVAGKAVLNENGVLTVEGDGLGALDGQHRKGGIDALMTKVGPDSDFAAETMPVVVITSDLSVPDRQQIFADVNRSAKVVSKALNVLYDHRDRYAVIAQKVAAELGPCVELTKTAPTPKSNCLASLSNIYNLALFIASQKGNPSDEMREGLNDDLVINLCVSIINALPANDLIKAGHLTYQAARSVYICYTSTLFQAIGKQLRQRLSGLEGQENIDTAVHLITETGDFWKADNPIWAKEKSEVIVGGKVGTRRENVANAVTVLESLWAKKTAIHQAPEAEAVTTAEATQPTA